MHKRVFYQDFLMDFEKDSNDYPIIELKYIDNIDNYCSIDEQYNLLDFINGKRRIVSFRKLHDMISEDEWKRILDRAKLIDMIIIVDDIEVINDEVQEMKDFYLKVYFWNFMQVNPNTFIYKHR